MAKFSKGRLDRGFTLVELLVVIAIIGILIGMLLPAVQVVREAARRTACMNKVRQMALSALNYESGFGRFPGGSEHINMEPNSSNDPTSLGWGWRTKLLPFMEQQNLFDNLDLTLSINGGNNPLQLSTVVETFICPSNPELATATHPVSGIDMSMSSYLGNGGSIEWAFVQWLDFSDGILMRSIDDKHQGITMGDVEDGTSNTFFCGETISYAVVQGNPFIWDPAFFAATNGSNASRTLGMVRTGHGEINPDWTTETDTILRNSYASLHAGGAVFAFVDGSTHFINDNIDHNNLTESEWRSGGIRGTYQRLFSRNDGLTVSDF